MIHKYDSFIEILWVFSTWSEVRPVVWMWSLISIVKKSSVTEGWSIINSFAVLEHHVIVSTVNTSKDSVGLERTIVQIGVRHPSSMTTDNRPEILMRRWNKWFRNFSWDRYKGISERKDRKVNLLVIPAMRNRSSSLASLRFLEGFCLSHLKLWLSIFLAIFLNRFWKFSSRTGTDLK